MIPILEIEPTNRPAGNAVLTGRTRQDLLAVSVAYALILVALWTPRPYQAVASLLALAWVVLATYVGFDGWSAMGLHTLGFRRSSWLLAVAALVAAAALFVASWLHTLHLPKSSGQFFHRYWAYAIWAFLQELLMLDFFLRRLLRVSRSRNAAILATTGLFAVAHLPNPILTPLTMVWGLAASTVFLNYRNIFAPALAHALLGICIAVTVPGPVDHNMRVGFGYLTYRPHAPLRHNSQRSQIDHTVSTAAWVIEDAPTRRSLRQARP